LRWITFVTINFNVSVLAHGASLETGDFLKVCAMTFMNQQDPWTGLVLLGLAVAEKARPVDLAQLSINEERQWSEL
jgi:hypothetical protein